MSEILIGVAIGLPWGMVQFPADEAWLVSHGTVVGKIFNLGGER